MVCMFGMGNERMDIEARKKSWMLSALFEYFKNGSPGDDDSYVSQLSQNLERVVGDGCEARRAAHRHAASIEAKTLEYMERNPSFRDALHDFRDEISRTYSTPVQSLMWNLMSDASWLVVPSTSVYDRRFESDFPKVKRSWESVPEEQRSVMAGLLRKAYAEHSDYIDMIIGMLEHRSPI